MSLKELQIRDEYRSDGDRLIQDFYIPCLEQATTYDRAVGFFSSSSMAAVAQGLNEVEREMEPSVGAEYVLVYYTAKEDAELEAMERHGRSYPLVKRSLNKFTWTEVVRVER